MFMTSFMCECLLGSSLIFGKRSYLLRPIFNAPRMLVTPADLRAASDIEPAPNEFLSPCGLCSRSECIGEPPFLICLSFSMVTRPLSRATSLLTLRVNVLSAQCRLFLYRLFTILSSCVIDFTDKKFSAVLICRLRDDNSNTSC